tara:strand:- start:343 stop:768 length:426 start_codon:yes stop_codon:yes gene_type:complete
MSGSRQRDFDFEKAQIGEDLLSYEYDLTQEMLDGFRRAVEDDEAPFPTLAARHDSSAFFMAFQENTAGVNAGSELEFYNPPIPGKKIKVTSRISDKYWRRDKPYVVVEATAIDEDGRLLERTRTFRMMKPDEVGKKWQAQN